jgi:ligand-binding SRPBCC domain-containing protein
MASKIMNITIKNISGAYQLETRQLLRISLREAWEFFSSPENLADITPPYMKFRIVHNPPKAMYEGLLISYRVSPFHWYRVNWVTEIRHVREGEYFVDEQRVGPYVLWYHEHFFESTEAGVLMTDRVTYKLPFGIVGRIVHWLYVSRQLQGIFDYRCQKLDNLFNPNTTP